MKTRPQTPVNKMLHDIILALGGVGGKVLNRILNEGILPLSSFDFHPCERNMLSQIINIADNYKTIQQFLKKVPHFGDETIVLDNGVEVAPGMYLRAFCNGVYDSLESYRRNLVRVEKEALQDPHQTATGILAQVAPYTPLLITLNSIINQIVARQLHGCKILQLIYQHQSSGIEMVDEAMARIMQCCHMVMLKQLTSFLLYGQLMDPYREFFIQECSQDLQNTSSSTLDSQGHAESVYSKPDLKKGVAPDYVIVQDMVPCYISPSVPEKTKFIGSTVVILSKDPRDEKLGTGIVKYQSLYDKMESSLLAQLKELQNVSALDLPSNLESVIEKIQSCVTQHLFLLAKDEANLRGELQLIKDYFLLGRGELFVVFLQKANNILLKAVMNNRTGQDLNNILHMSIRNVNLNSDTIVDKFSFKVPLKDKHPMAQPNSTVWKQMTLHYEPPWPLHLLFKADELDVYDKLFNFLLQVKMAELNLHHVWLEIVKKKDTRLPPNVWSLHNMLLYLVGNLQCYLHQDVITCHFSRLCAELDRTQDFHQVIHLHSVFLSSVTSECFVDIHPAKEDQPSTRHPVNKCLMNILHLCDNFCDEIAREEMREKNFEQITLRLDKNVGILMNLISVLGNKASGLRLLLLRLDYNRHFSSRLYGEA
ncbi:gamma-tubulin complex component 4-like [Macrosteles quadrilineatus]|uniref:gamma-tubulin complex component 4-like n=1 Tax=Macrosteles quadrilineatus TaxID=74068 RepID=UPI0023E1952F|nr:gamma-tubulin complex component 4-like [Macrosteles quadrilineatus]